MDVELSASAGTRSHGLADIRVDRAAEQLILGRQCFAQGGCLGTSRMIGGPRARGAAIWYRLSADAGAGMRGG